MLIVTGDGIPARRVGDGLREGRTTTTNRTFTSSHIPTMRRAVRTRTDHGWIQNLPRLLLPHTRHATGNTAFADGAASAQPAHFRISPRPLGPERFASVQDRSQPSNTRVCALSNIHAPFRYASSMHHPARAGQGWLIGQDGRPQPAIPEQGLGHGAWPKYRSTKSGEFGGPHRTSIEFRQLTPGGSEQAN
ncbi:hypothetical protein ACVWZV_007258 [Bradyrhizobium sp. GM5.1]